MSNYNEALQGNNAALEEILETVKSLPSEKALDIKICDDNLMHLVVDGKPVGDGVRMLGAEFVGAHYEVDENGNPVLDENGDPVVSFYERLAIDYLDVLANYEESTTSEEE